MIPASHIEALPVSCWLCCYFAAVLACTVTCLAEPVSACTCCAVVFFPIMSASSPVRLQDCAPAYGKAVNCHCRMMFSCVFFPCFSHVSCIGQNASINVSVTQVLLLLTCAYQQSVHMNFTYSWCVAVIQYNLWRSHCSKGCSNFEDTVSDVDVQASYWFPPRRFIGP